jgi:hypothetical protein
LKKAKSLIYNKRALARNKEDKDYTKSEKQLLISLINDYSLFGATDNEIIQLFFLIWHRGQ